MNKYADGDIINGTVTGIESYGIFLVFDDNKSGLIHISEISDSFVNNIYDYARVGDCMKAKIIGCDDNGHYKLSIKPFNEKKNLQKIHETSSGAVNLFNSLDGWIDDMILEIEKK